MPTPKQTRHHYKKCRRYFYLLLEALADAHQADVIDYEEKLDPVTGKMKDTHPSVCTLVYNAKDNFKTATRRQLAKALEEELMSEMKGAW